MGIFDAIKKVFGKKDALPYEFDIIIYYLVILAMMGYIIAGDILNAITVML